MNLLELLTNPAVAGFGGTIAGACVAWATAHTSKPADIQVAINSSFGELMHGFRDQLDAARVELCALRERVEVQSSEINALNAHVIQLTNLLSTHGITAPARPVSTRSILKGKAK